MKADDLRRRLAKAEEAFADHPDVTAVGIGEKVTAGRHAGTDCFVVFVEDKGQPTGGIVPKEIEIDGITVPIDVRTAPKASFRTSDGFLNGSDRIIAPNANRAGTLAMVVREAGGLGRLFGMTNAHVVARPDTDATGDPISAEIDGATIPIGNVAYQASYRSGGVRNTVDLAMIELNTAASAIAQPYVIETFPGVAVQSTTGLSFSRFSNARKPHQYGGSTDISRDVVGMSNPTEFRAIRLRDSTNAVMRFGRAFSLQAGNAGVQGGHSGALIVRDRSNGAGLLAAGLLAGGAGGIGYAFSFQDILAELRRVSIRLA